ALHNRHFLGDLLAHATGGHVVLRVRDAHLDRAAGLVGHATADVDGVRLGVALRDAAGARHRHHLGPHLLLAHRHPDHLGVALGDLLHLGHRLLDPHRAGHPRLDGLGPDRLAGVGALVAALLVAEHLLHAVVQARPARDLTALVVAVVLALALDV